MTWGAKGIRIHENVEKANFYGLELQGVYKPIQNFEAFGKAEYLRGFLNPDFNLPLIPPLQGNFGQTWISKNGVFWPKA